MSAVLSHTSDTPQASSEEMASLVRNLDNLLERYLELLHNYQILRQKLGKNLSSGFLSLAQANFSNQNRVRYGQDFYDERMRASLLISINLPDTTFSIANPSLPPNSTPPTPPGLSSLSPSDTPSVSEHEVPEPSASTKKNTPTSPCNPLNWFGILVPPALRQAQQSFKLAVEASVPAMVTITAEMREIEIEVRRTRKKLGKLK